MQNTEEENKEINIQSPPKGTNIRNPSRSILISGTNNLQNQDDLENGGC